MPPHRDRQHQRQGDGKHSQDVANLQDVVHRHPGNQQDQQAAVEQADDAARKKRGCGVCVVHTGRSAEVFACAMGWGNSSRAATSTPGSWCQCALGCDGGPSLRGRTEWGSTGAGLWRPTCRARSCVWISNARKSSTGERATVAWVEGETAGALSLKTSARTHRDAIASPGRRFRCSSPRPQATSAPAISPKPLGRAASSTARVQRARKPGRASTSPEPSQCRPAAVA